MSQTVPALLSGSGTATDRIPRDRSDYTRMDNRIESIIRRGEIEPLLDFAENHPRRVGDMLGNYRLVLAQWEESNPESLRKLLTLTWNRLDISTRKQFIHLMIRMIYRTSMSESVSKGIETGDIKVSPFNFKGDEVVLEKTIEHMIEGQPLSYEHIFVLDRKKRKKAVGVDDGCLGFHAGSKSFHGGCRCGSPRNELGPQRRIRGCPVLRKG